MASLKRGSTSAFVMGAAGVVVGAYMTFSDGFSGGAPFFQLATFLLMGAWIMERCSRPE